MLDRKERERSGVQKLRQAFLMEETGEYDRGLAGPQHSQCCTHHPTLQEVLQDSCGHQGCSTELQPWHTAP